MSEPVHDLPEYATAPGGRYTAEEHLKAQQEQINPQTGAPMHEADVKPADAPEPADTAQDAPARIGEDEVGGPGPDGQGTHTE